MRTAEQEEIAREDGASVLKEENGGLVLLSSIRVRCPLDGRVGYAVAGLSAFLPPPGGRGSPRIDRETLGVGFGMAEMMRATGAAAGMGGVDPDIRLGHGAGPRYPF